jgi:hypothetical protein
VACCQDCASDISAHAATGTGDQPDLLHIFLMHIDNPSDAGIVDRSFQPFARFFQIAHQLWMQPCSTASQQIGEP